MNAVLKSLNHLSVEEKLQLVEDLWDDIDEMLMPPMNDALKQELDRRVSWTDAKPGTERTLDDIAVSLGVKL